DIVKSRRFHPSIQARLESGQAADDVPGQSTGCKARDEFREKLRTAVVALMDGQQLDALIYPTWSNPPRLIGDLNTPGGDNNQLFSPSTGFPAITVPMGYTRAGTLPAGLQFFGRAWSERVCSSSPIPTSRPPIIAGRRACRGGHAGPPLRVHTR